MEGHIFIYGEIVWFQDDDASSWGCVNLKDVQQQIQSQPDAESLVVHINSIGGDVNEGFAIHDVLRSSGKKIITQVEGLCASIATVIMLAGDERRMTENSEIMIHNPWTVVGGESKDLQKTADELKTIENKLSAFYAENTNLSVEQSVEFMNNETKFNANESLTHGFVGEIMTQIKAVAKFKSKSNNMSKENPITVEQAESMFQKFENKMKNLFKSKPKNLIVQDANGTELDFGESVEQLSEIEIGMTGITVDGSPADGEFILPDGRTLVFVGGELTEINEPAADDDEGQELIDLRAENERLTEQISGIESKFEKDFADFKDSMTSKFTPQASDNDDDGAPKIRRAVSKK